MDEDKDETQGPFLGDLFEGFLWDHALGLQGRSQDFRRASSLSFIPRAPISAFLALLKAQKHPPLNHLIPRPHLEHSEDMTSSVVVLLIVLKAPGVGEQVISVSTIGQTH